jgi:TPR repeat protein
LDNGNIFNIVIIVQHRLGHAGLPMVLARSIELAPKNGDFIVLQDGWTGSWEVGRWAQETGSWVQIDGKPLRIFPTHWVPVSGDAAGSENSEDLSFLVPPLQEETTPKRPRTPSILAFTAVVIFIGGCAAFGIGFTGTGSVEDSSFDKITGSGARLKREAYGQRDEAGGIARELAAAREEIALHIRRENAVQADAAEAKRLADASQKELKLAIDKSEARAEALERENTALASKTINDNVVAPDGAVQTGPLDRPIQEPNAAPGMAGVVRNAQNPNEMTAGAPIVADPDSASMLVAPGNTVIDPRQPPADPGGQPQSTAAIYPAGETRLIARAESLIKQSDFAGARLLLEHALEKGSARAAFMMAETYDWRALRSVQAYGIRGDAEKARELYELAAVAGVDQARERLEALKSGSNP